MKADLDYRLPSSLTGELLSVAVTAVNSTPNSRTRPTTTLFQLITGKRPHMKKFKFGQMGMCEYRRADSEPSEESTWAHRAAWIATSGYSYLREAYSAQDAHSDWRHGDRQSPRPRSGTTRGDADPRRDGSRPW